MAIQSGGVVLKTPSVIHWQGSTSEWPEIELVNRWAAYGTIYREQLWVYTVVNKRAKATARLPLKVYERNDKDRPEARDHPYALLLRRPSSRYSPFFMWMWASSTADVFGEFFFGKLRDRGGRPVELIPLHPTSMHAEDERDGRVVWRFQNSTLRIDNIPDEDLVHPRTFNPDSVVRGMSALEPLRRTLENEDASRRATSAFWKNGGRPSVLLTHPGQLSQAAGDRLRLQWDSLHGGVDNFGKTAVLEEGMKPEIVSLNSEEAQYIESRRLNREEVCGAYDVPPPVVHILDRATYSNITEQMRSMYRDTMAPHLKWLEAELEHQLRASSRPGVSEPDFGDDVYAEFLLDEVLRGDFEVRAEAYQKAINSGWIMPSEVRSKENLPFVEGSDRLFVQGAMMPLLQAASPPDVGDDNGAEPTAQPTPPLADELPMAPDEATVIPMRRGLDAETVRTLMGRLSRPATLADVDGAALVSGLNGHASQVLAELNSSKAIGESVAQFRARIKALGG